MNVVKLELARGLGRHLRAGHPWVFRKALEHPPRIPAGSVVDLTENGKFVARGYYDPHSAIAVRVLTRDSRETVDSRFITQRVQRSLAARTSLIDLKDTDSYRLIHGEGDGLPGVVVDLYAGWAVMKLYSAGLTPYRPLIVEALKAGVPGLKGIIGRDEVGRDDVEEDDGRGTGRMLWGEEAPELIPIRERGAVFMVDAWRGQKTGFFLDQRENRHLIRRLGQGRDVLNCFCFSGGFSVNAALGGAKSVFSVDQDPEAIALARENFTRNGLPAEKHDFLAADVFALIQSFKEEGRTFDLIILDPPAFAKSQRAVEAAIDGYASLNRQALALLRPGGLLATASCSARVNGDMFMGAVREAGFKAGVDLALVEERYQPPDHPVRLQFPEGKYLKFYVMQAV
ncbi:class I SAM-dependent rRNA methyltransferase [Corallococcus praedator]|uniref:Class I SAM-dependent rRNA methyltransferase n=3 Tax=Corallococcus TaxID=83461 RepID=A0A3A8J422_9BACT|nr:MULTISPECIES: class I SAM-dependent rRNA methyltransferase [Corallococcus]MBE4753500.1 class I SAM-dependent rRNA methyltransferase [Corallococcus soli]RYZ38242.1 MAG: class I SAM-dependent rRNA methyltransferase [Myxococcaceae bacterium]MCY1032559.1 class I SAM-dependent rRNA methyltransferase [Corallococcus sp. BB11-1]MCY1041799.1 class I SAM-dependent rRNA methyltransferase [Corallococcus sp. bb12-1]RKG86650.1 class I SAM-dependent rRNA methyltransferase [Corallococcus terminator]